MNCLCRVSGNSGRGEDKKGCSKQSREHVQRNKAIAHVLGQQGAPRDSRVVAHMQEAWGVPGGPRGKEAGESETGMAKASHAPKRTSGLVL